MTSDYDFFNDASVLDDLKQSMYAEPRIRFVVNGRNRVYPLGLWKPYLRILQNVSSSVIIDLDDRWKMQMNNVTGVDHSLLYDTETAEVAFVILHYFVLDRYSMGICFDAPNAIALVKMMVVLDVEDQWRQVLDAELDSIFRCPHFFVSTSPAKSHSGLCTESELQRELCVTTFEHEKDIVQLWKVLKATGYKSSKVLGMKIAQRKRQDFDTLLEILDGDCSELVAMTDIAMATYQMEMMCGM